MSRLSRKLASVFALCVLVTQTVLASGSCCVLSLNGRDRPMFSVIGSLAMSHERLGGSTYDLTQRAVILKGSYPLNEFLFLSAQIGLPASTNLSSASGTLKGNTGFLYGASVAVALPEILHSVEILAAAGYSRSVASVKSASSGASQTFNITELQTTVVAEVTVVPELAAYAGARMYFGRNRLHHDATGVIHEGDREGNFSPLFGLRVNLWERIGLIAEGSLGHTRVASLTAAFHL